MTLTEFLLARIAADEAAAQEEAERLAERWREIAAVGMPAVVLTDWSLGPGSTFRVLDECNAKRRIVEMHGPSDERNRWCSYCAGTDHAEYPCETSRILASVYADHMDFREEWRLEHDCDQERLVVICDEDGQPDHELCPVCKREFY